MCKTLDVYLYNWQKSYKCFEKRFIIIFEMIVGLHLPDYLLDYMHLMKIESTLLPRMIHVSRRQYSLKK